MKHLLRTAAFGILCPVIGLAQEASTTPPPISSPAPPVPRGPAVVAPPEPPAPPAPPRPPQTQRREGVFLGVEVGRVPSVVSEQLNLPEGFGVLVDYVVPGSAAESAGVKPHDILKQLDDQIITSAEQLAVLVRSFSDGQEVTLVVVHKGQESRLTTKLHPRAARDADRDEQTRPHHRRADHGNDWDNDFSFDFSGFPNGDYMEQLQKQMARNRAQVEASTARALEQARRNVEDAEERAARASGSRLDYDRAHVVLRDATGRIELRVAHGKRSLKVRDEQGKVVFDGPINTAEQRKAIPADVLPRVEALEKERDTVFPKRDEDDDDRDGDSL